MREIKFRAWDKLGDDEGNLCMRSWDQLLRDKYANSADSIFNDKMLILMQYTGIKDKNGVEIYEGDVLRESGEYPDGSYDERVFNVEWFVDDIHSGWNIAPCDTWYSCVIGNVCENPELVKEST